jgi:hypothetical protein
MLRHLLFPEGDDIHADASQFASFGSTRISSCASFFWFITHPLFVLI